MVASRKPAVYVTVGGQTFAPGSEIPADLAKLIDNPKVWAAEDETPAEPKTIDEMDKAELEAEIARRNAERPEADAIAVDGNTKAKLLEALQADDAAQV